MLPRADIHLCRVQKGYRIGPFGAAPIPTKALLVLDIHLGVPTDQSLDTTAKAGNPRYRWLLVHAVQ
jgi:hypothetical protein